MGPSSFFGGAALDLDEVGSGKARGRGLGPTATLLPFLFPTMEALVRKA